MRRLSCLLLLLWACDDGGDSTPAGDAGGVPDAAEADVPAAPLERALVTHSFGEIELDGFEERQNCVAWTLENEQSIYVERIEFNNGGAFHHSNWFVVPEGVYPGPDGFFNCRDRGFDELNSAVEGTVIFAQSTQSRYEEQRLGDGIVIKIPPRHKVVAGTHFLNLSSAPVSTRLRMTFEIVHPEVVDTIVSPFRLNYLDLQIPPQRASHHTAACEFADQYEAAAGVPLDMKLYWLLPHYHGLGNYFDVSIVGGPRDGESLHRVEGFDAEPHGKAFDPPVDLTGARGLAMTCGYDNPRPVPVNYGVGDQEMCVLLGFAESRTLFDASVNADSAMDGEELGITYMSGPCTPIAVPKNAAQSAPSAEELDAALYVPPSDVDPDEVVGPPECEDTPADAAPSIATDIETLQQAVFLPSCSFNACHGGARPAGDLDLASEGVAERLLAHVSPSNPDAPFIKAGAPEESWFYQRISRCEPGGMNHMPLNAPTLLDPGLVAAVRDWIADL